MERALVLLLVTLVAVAYAAPGPRGLFLNLVSQSLAMRILEARLLTSGATQPGCLSLSPWLYYEAIPGEMEGQLRTPPGWDSALYEARTLSQKLCLARSCDLEVGSFLSWH